MHTTTVDFKDGEESFMRLRESAQKQSSWRGLFLSVLVGCMVLGLLIYISSDLRLAITGLVAWNSESLAMSLAHEREIIPPTRSAPSDVRSVTVSPTIQHQPAINPSAAGVKKTLIVRVRDEKTNQTIEIFDEPIPPFCFPQNNTDYDGEAVKWGLGTKATSAAECCRQCKEFKGDRPCHIWVYCADPSGSCWTMDIHEHTTGDCWLKHQAEWDGNADLTKSNLKINHRGAFSKEFKAEHKTTPELIPWMAGVIPPKKGR